MKAFHVILLKFKIYLIVVAGFGYQAFLVCDDYFKYKTITHITIEAKPSQRDLHTIVVCYQTFPRYFNQTASELFKVHLNEMVYLRHSLVYEDCKVETKIDVKIHRLFANDHRYCLAIQPKQE